MAAYANSWRLFEHGRPEIELSPSELFIFCPVENPLFRFHTAWVGDVLAPGRPFGRPAIALLVEVEQGSRFEVSRALVKADLGHDALDIRIVHAGHGGVAVLPC